MGRAMIALFIVAFFFMFVSFTTGIVGCWRTSPSNITSSAILMLLACKYYIGVIYKINNNTIYNSGFLLLVRTI